MRLLLDTHSFIWFLFEAAKLPDATKQLIEDAEAVSVSICSLWEIAIKQGIGKLDLETSIEELVETCNAQDIDVAEIGYRHLDATKALPLVHKDPFDRLLVATAQCEDMTIVTKDENIPKYDVQTVWQ